MSYMALYRKYRPTTFETVAGQKHIVTTLSNALKENKIAHAYLFCGPRGTGKTSMARLFAKALNCEEGFGHQCNSCPNCQAINKGSHPDVIEIDAASNRGIDDIRDLISKVKYSPTLGKYKVYIVDEVHMLTVEAFNALLKTLEEPPSNVIFILCTTEPYKLMQTILSRVQRYDFTRIADKDLFDNLVSICNKENIEVEEDALKQIVTLADGGARDSLSLLDQAIAYSGNKLELHHVQELFGLSTIEEKVTLLKELNNSNVKFVIEKLDSFIAHGTDIKRLTSELIEIIKDLIIYKTTSDVSILKLLTRKEVEEIDISKIKLNKILDILLGTYAQYRYVNNINSLLEVAFIKICSLDDAPVQEVVVKKEEKPIVKEVVKEVIVEKVVQPTPAPTPIIEKKETPAPKEFRNVSEFAESGDTYTPSEADILNLMQQGNKLEKQRINDAWPKLNDLLTSPSIGKYVSMLTQCFPRIVAKDILVLEAEFQNIVNKMSLIDNQKGLSKIVETITGTKYTILVLSHQNFVGMVTKFSNLRQAGKLPEPYPIEIKISKDEKKSSKSPTEQFAEDFK